MGIIVVGPVGNVSPEEILATIHRQSSEGAVAARHFEDMRYARRGRQRD
jgi:hypothetical protein